MSNLQELKIQKRGASEIDLHIKINEEMIVKARAAIKLLAYRILVFFSIGSCVLCVVLNVAEWYARGTAEKQIQDFQQMLFWIPWIRHVGAYGYPPNELIWFWINFMF